MTDVGRRVLAAMTSGRGEALCVTAGAIGVVLSYLWIAPFGVDLVDEGYFMDLATRVMHGQLPYRDFDTYYTPGMFYLDAGAFSAFGVDALHARWLMIGIRIACLVLVYRLGRRLAPWPFAALPPLVLAAMDLAAGSHPAWPALFCTLLMLESLAHHQQQAACRSRGGSGWLLLAGAAAGLAFAFKQNVGAFAALAGIGCLLIWPACLPVRWLAAARIAYGVVTFGLVYHLLAPELNALLAATLVLPLGIALVLLTIDSGPSRHPHATFRDLACFSGGLGVVTLVWLIPLVRALGVAATPFALFVGDVNQGALLFPLDALPEGAPLLAILAVWLPVGVSALLRRPSRPLLGPTLGASLASVVVLGLPLRVATMDSLGSSPGTFPRLDWLDLEFGSLFLYIPALIAWSTIVWLLWRMLRSSATSRRAPWALGAVEPYVASLLLVGVLAQVALFPRADTLHAVLAGAPLLPLGAWILARAHRRLAGQAGWLRQAGVFAVLLVLPLAAVAPHLYGRFVNLHHPDAPAPDGPWVALGVTSASILVPERTAEHLGGAVHFIQDRTPPGEPVFAYPLDPMVNVLVDRPNPTRFDHFLPGALSSDDMHAVVKDLDTRGPRFVLWDHAAVVFWETDKPNRILSDYIWSCYRQVATFDLYLVLERSCAAGTEPILQANADRS